MGTSEVRLRDLEILNSISCKAPSDVDIFCGENHADPREVISVLNNPYPQQGPFFALVREGGINSWWGVLRHSQESNVFELLSRKNATVAFPAESLIDIGYVDNGMLVGARSFRRSFFSLRSRSMRMDVVDAFHFFITPFDYNWKSIEQCFMQHIGYGNTDAIGEIAKSSHIDLIPVAMRPPVGRIMRQDIPLNYAISLGMIDSVDALLQNGYDPNAIGDSGSSPGFKAAANGDERLLALLSENGVNWGIADTRGLTPLHISIINGNIKFALKLIEMRVPVDKGDQSGWTPLHYIQDDEIEILNAIVQSGADVNARNKDGDTPLHFAIVNEYASVIGRLVDLGADLHLKNNAGDSPMSMIGYDLKKKLGW